MSQGPIDWEHPPSQRRGIPVIGRRLVFDVAVAGAAAMILQVLLGALLGADGLSERGMRHYMVDAIPGSRTLAWGVVAVCGLAAVYAVVDVVRALVEYRRAVRAEEARPQFTLTGPAADGDGEVLSPGAPVPSPPTDSVTQRNDEER